MATYSIGEQIVQAMAKALCGASTLPTGGVYSAALGATVYRSRTDPFTRAQVPAVNLISVGGPIDQPVIPKLQWKKTVHVQIFVRASPAPDTVADAIKVAANAALMADMGLGGLALQIIPVAEHIQLSDADTESCVLTLEYEIEYRTDQVNLAIQ
jgi:hypothetical protein